MKLGLFTPVFGSLDVKQMLAKVQALGKIQAIEVGTGGWPGNGHLDMDALLQDQARLADYRTMIADAGLTISALSCHGNPLHPDANVARQYKTRYSGRRCASRTAWRCRSSSRSPGVRATRKVRATRIG